MTNTPYIPDHAQSDPNDSAPIQPAEFAGPVLSASTPLLNSKFYDLLKFLAQILLPAVGTLYFALASIWGLPNAGEVVGSITAVDAFLGVLLGLSTIQYNNSDARYDGVINVLDGGDDGSTVNIVDGGNVIPAAADKGTVTFKVNTIS